MIINLLRFKFKVFSFLFIIFSGQISLAQKNDFVWALGSIVEFDQPFDYGLEMNFNNDKLETYTVERPMSLQLSVSSISNNEGSLQFYTNGSTILNFNHDTIEGGEYLCDQSVSNWLNDWWCEDGFNSPHTTLIIPSPTLSSDNLYYLFHNNANTNEDLDFFVDSLFVTQINMDLNNGAGKVTDLKFPIVVEDSLGISNLTAAKHGNGNDWWVIQPHDKKNLYYMILLSSEGVKVTHTQSIGIENFKLKNGLSINLFTPDGTKFIRNLGKDGIQIFDFDRFTGNFSNPRIIPYRYDCEKVGEYYGMSISSDSRFLYASRLTVLDQFDLDSEDIPMSFTRIDTFDGFGDPLSNTFFTHQLAPNDKIYINSLNGTKHLHVIENPNLKGDECNFMQHGIELPQRTNSNLANYPNYRLGPLLSISHENNPDVKIYPNPVIQNLSISNLEGYLNYKIFDLLGINVDQGITNDKINVQEFSPGTYILQLEFANESKSVYKFVKL